MVYVLNIHFLDDQRAFEYYRKRIPSSRREKLDRIIPTNEKKRSLAAGLLLVHGLREWGVLGESDTEISFLKGDNGKPYLNPDNIAYTGEKELCSDSALNSAEMSVPYFSLSHSGDYAVCAIGDSEIGIDIERMEQWNKAERAYERVLTANEKERLNLLSEAERAGRFYQYWSMKESYVKSLGTGLGTDFREIDLYESGPQIRKLVIRELQIDSPMDRLIEKSESIDYDSSVYVVRGVEGYELLSVDYRPEYAFGLCIPREPVSKEQEGK